MSKTNKAKDPIDYFDSLNDLDEFDTIDENTDDDQEALDLDEADTDAELAALDDGDTGDDYDDVEATPDEGETVEDYADEPMEDDVDADVDTDVDETDEGANEADTDEDTDEDTEGVDNEVKALRKENAKRRVQLQNLREQVTERAENLATVRLGDLYKSITGKQFGDGNTPVTFGNIATELANYVINVETSARDAKLQLALEKVAAELGANTERLADSVSFTNEVSNIDLDNPDYLTQIKRAMQNAIQVNPAFKEPVNAPRSGVDMTITTNDMPLGDGIHDLAKRRRERRNHG